jgi:hypothetical protein
MQAQSTRQRLVLSRHGRPVSSTEADDCQLTFNARDLSRGESMFLYSQTGAGWRMSGYRVATGGSYAPFDPTMPVPSSDRHTAGTLASMELAAIDDMRRERWEACRSNRLQALKPAPTPIPF